MFLKLSFIKRESPAKKKLSFLALALAVCLNQIASKHGVVGLTRTAALEYVKQGIRVNAVNPGLIDTQIARDVVAGNEEAYAALEQGVPMGRAGRPEEIASVVLWLCSPGASYVVGHALTVDGGVTVV